MTLSLSRRALVGLIVGGSAVGLLGGSAVGYNVYYTDRIVPGVTVMGQTPSAVTADELRAALNERVSKATLTVSVEGTNHVASAQDVGVSVDVEGAVARAMEPSASFRGRMSTPVNGWDVPLTHTIDEAQMRTYIQGLIENEDAHMKNAAVSFDAKAGRFTVDPGRTGKQVDTSQVRDAVTKLATDLAPVSITLAVTEETPTVTTEDAERFVAAAHKLMATQISITDGIDTFWASDADKAQWVKVPTVGTPLGAPQVDASKIAQWVQATAKATNVDPVPGVNNVNSRGVVVSVHEAGKSGWTVTNVEAVTKEVNDAFTSGTAYSGDFDYDETKPEMTTRLIADGAKSSIYAAAPGEKWIDIDLSANTVSAYEGGTIVYGPVYMVPGAPETPTVTGTFRVWHQNPLQTMRGYNADGTKYETPNVPWATYFHGDFALHGAPWRSSFGWSGAGGSHGCVNMPVDGARWFYEWANIGTVVVSHY